MATLGRPKSDEKRARILRAAADLFTNHGYANTSLEQVADAANVSKQTIYSHFSGKADVLREGVKQRCLEGELTLEWFDLTLPPEQFLPQFTERFLGVVLEATALAMYRLCLSEGQRHPELGIAFFESGPKLVQETLSAYLSHAHDRQQLHVPDPALAAIQFLYMVKGFPSDQTLLGLNQSSLKVLPEDYVAQCCAMFLRAYQKQ